MIHLSKRSNPFHLSPTRNMSPHGVLILLLFLLLLLFTVKDAATSGKNTSKKDEEMMVPLLDGKMEVLLNDTRRKLGSFRICALCTCCGGAKGLCLPSPCCYAINCNIPNRPFGFCSFTPKTCNCFGCHL